MAAKAGLDRLVFLLDTDADDLGIPASRLIDPESGDRQDAFRRRCKTAGYDASLREPGRAAPAWFQGRQAETGLPARYVIGPRPD